MSWWKRDWSFCLILAVVTILAYQPAWHGGLLWDDAAHVGGPELRTLDGLRRIWFVPRTTQQYYPLLHTSYWLQQRLWGDSPTGYHLVNLLLHIGCVVLVLKILRLLRIPGAALAAILFALHPVNVETVAWITERKNTLSGVFCLAATLWHLKFDESRNRRSYAMALGLFLLGLLSKTAIVTLPLGLLGILWSLRRWSRAPLAGVLIYIFMLLPTLGFLNQFFFIYSFVSDHWQYLACLGIITPCASGIVLLAGQLKSWQAWLERGTILLLPGVLFLLTWQQSRMYTDAETLYRTTIARNPGCWMAYNNLGNTLSQANRIPEAMDLFKQALRINPDNGAAYYNLGNALVLTGRTSEAIDQYKQALRIIPNYAKAHNNLGNALVLTGQTSEAIDQYG